MKSIIVNYSLLEPCIFPHQFETGNELKSGAIIPGTTIYGAFASEFKHLDSDEGIFKNLFLSDELIFQNGFPVKNDIKKYPSPLSWGKCKNSEQMFEVEHDCCDLMDIDSHEKFQNMGLCKQCGGVIKNNGSKWVGINEKKLQSQEFSIEYEMNSHNSIETESQSTDENALYSTMAVSQWNKSRISEYSSKILFKSDEVYKRFIEKFPLDEVFELTLGKSRSRGYGLVEVELSDYEINETLNISGEIIDIYFISPGILSSTVYGAVKENILKNDLSIFNNFPEYTEENIIGDFVTVSGFNSMTGLPRPRMVAISSGSVVRLRFKEKIESNDVISDLLRNITERGIGLRTSEGFGQVLIGTSLGRVSD